MRSHPPRFRRRPRDRCRASAAPAVTRADATSAPGRFRRDAARLASRPCRAIRCWRECSSPAGHRNAPALAVVQIGDGKTPAVPLAALRPADRLDIGGRTVGRVDPAQLRALERPPRMRCLSIHAADVARVYVNVKPLFDEAYRELGYPGGDFDDAIVRAIRMLSGHAGCARRSGAAQARGLFRARRRGAAFAAAGTETIAAHGTGKPQADRRGSTARAALELKIVRTNSWRLTADKYGTPGGLSKPSPPATTSVVSAGC